MLIENSKQKLELNVDQFKESLEHLSQQAEVRGCGDIMSEYVS